VKLVFPTLFFATLLFSTKVFSIEPLSDTQLDDVTAGNISVPIQIDQFTAGGTHIVVDGDVQVQSSLQNNFLTLSDNAQQNLSSLININAVNSPVNVLLNLNINIDSTIGVIKQYNLNGQIPKN